MRGMEIPKRLVKVEVEGRRKLLDKDKMVIGIEQSPQIYGDQIGILVLNHIGQA
jgi:hypothetical protein